MINKTLWNEFRKSQNLGEMPDPSVIGQEGPTGEGLFMKIYLLVDQGVIRNASFETNGCPTSVSCGNWLTEWTKGKTPEETNVMDAESLQMVLGGLPPGKDHCALLAVKALRNAVRQLAESSR
jgi:NifU-like protein involved in Fe-S cluster formation